MIPVTSLQNRESWGLSQPASVPKITDRSRTIWSVGFVVWVPPLLLPIVALIFLRRLQPWVFMWGLAICIYLGMKWLTWRRVQKPIRRSPWRSAAYLMAWPGMDARSFLDETIRAPVPRFHEWCWALFETSLGAFLVWFVPRALPSARPLLLGWVGMLGLILLLHFGAFQILALVWRSLGVNVSPIMFSPLRSKSLSEFWGRRWNLSFRLLAHQLIFLPSHKYLPSKWATLLVFLASGLVHDTVISVPARAGYGLPTAYFLLQGLGVLVERATFGKRLGLGRGIRGWLFMAIIVAAPLYWLFHPVFVMRVVLPFMQAIRAL